MAQLKRTASDTEPSTSFGHDDAGDGPTAPGVVAEGGPKVSLRRITPPELVSLRLGCPQVILGFDVETHDWKESPRVTRTGKFHWFTRTHSSVMDYSRMVELGWTFGSVGQNTTLTKKSKRVIPEGWTVSSKAFEFHNISTEDAQAGERLEDVLKEFLTDVRHVCAQGGRICAHNFEFDAGIVLAELTRCGFEDLQTEWLETGRNNGYCTMNPDVGRWIWQCLGYEVGPPSAKHTKGLAPLVRIFAPERIDLYNNIKLHSAIIDAEASKVLYEAYLNHARDTAFVEEYDDTQPFEC